MKRCVILSLLIIIACSSFVLAVDSTSGFNEETSYTWLEGKVADWSTIPDISTIAFAILALNNHGSDVSGGVARLKSLQDATFCWPKGDCKVDDTALATLALYKSGQDVTKSVEWLENVNGALNPALATGKWHISIIADGTGKCTLKYSSGQIQDVTLDGQGADVDITSKITNKVSENVNVDCGSITGGGSIIIQLSYKTGSNFYILKNEKASSLDITVANGCYGTTFTSTGCDYLSSIYASWVLSEMNREILTNAYLESVLETQYPSEELKHALVARITEKENYMIFLIDLQGSDGSWKAGNVYTTAWASFALSKYATSSIESQNGLDFLRKVVSGSGSWNNNVKDTAMALIALHGGDLTGSGISPSIITTCTLDSDCGEGEICNLTTSQCEYISGGGEICDNYIDDDADDLIDCDDSDCTSDPTCTPAEYIECDPECDAGYSCDGVSGQCMLMSTGCNDDGLCDSGEDCTCGDCPACASETSGCTDDGECADDEKCVDSECVTKKGFPTGIVVGSISVLALGGLAWFLVKSGKLDISKITGMFSKKPKSPKQPSFTDYARYKPIQQNQPKYAPPRAQPMGKTKEDLELEKSLKEAEKLLYGK